MEIRGGYYEPLHYLQIELLDKIRKEGSSEYNDNDNDTATLEMTIMVTITSVAIALRNTG
jgi:phosphoenolpyruvate carboxylase